MPNYRYQSSDYMNMRRGNCRSSMTSVQSSCQDSRQASLEASCRGSMTPVQSSCQDSRQASCEAPCRGSVTPVQSSCQDSRQASCEASCRETTAPVCCNDKASYDELRGMPLAMAYVAWQEWCSLYEADKAFRRGTIFEELDKPFRGIGGCCK